MNPLELEWLRFRFKLARALVWLAEFVAPAEVKAERKRRRG